ncbi:unnamed protein product [Cyprideis torosa]|uniref:Uncharacterized protein n=1 Tax=Cyprideis torosa TaxID=163714 RepID=A0A7R8WKC2_9CRUS|nr:unnamed protein product [Cyprideis torosa]CAG0901176.1 unnamed protein product [Cyprideis torosa]
MTLFPRKDGGPNVKFWEHPDVIQSLEECRVVEYDWRIPTPGSEFLRTPYSGVTPGVTYLVHTLREEGKPESVKNWLLKNGKKSVQADPPTAKTLSQLVIQLIQFQDDNFGKEVQKPALTRLPMHQLLDFRPGGSLCHLLLAAFKFKADQGWRRFDLQSPSRMDRNVEMCIFLEKSLVAAKCYRLPMVYIRADIEKSIQQKLKDLVKKHQGMVTEKQDEATHVIHNPFSTPPKELWLRPWMHRGDATIIHWFGMPDSHDNFTMSLPETDFDIPEGPERTRECWHVSADWILDMEEYNEWMNEEDYLVDESYFDALPGPCLQVNGKRKAHRMRLTSEELTAALSTERRTKKRRRSPSPKASGSKRKGRGTPSQSAKKQKRGGSASAGLEDDEDEDLTMDMEDPPSETSLKEVAAAEGATTPLPPKKGRESLTDLDEQVLGVDSGLGKTSAAQAGPGTTAAAGMGSSTEGQMGGAASSVTTDVKDEENATEQAHHIIIPSYSAWFDYNAVHTIEKRALPEFFNGRNKSKTPEVFLAYRNFMVDTYRLNPTEYLCITACRRNLVGDVCAIMRVHAFLEQWGLINYQVDTDTRPTSMGPPPTSHFHVLADTPSGIQPVNPPKTPQPSAAAKILLDLEKGAEDERKEEGVGERVEVKREEGEGEPKALLPDNVGLRTDQYARKPAVLRNKQSGSLARDWTDQETLLLLEALEMYKDDWNQVCSHVGTRTQEECILHFLRLPIEDPYLETNMETGDGTLGPLAFQPIPFSKAGSPVMSTVAFLASVVDPRVASAAAKAALEEFAKIRDEVPSSLVQQHTKAVLDSAKKGQKVDPSAGLSQTGIAGTEEEEKKEGGDKEEKGEEPQKMETNQEEEKKPGGWRESVGSKGIIDVAGGAAEKSEEKEAGSPSEAKAEGGATVATPTEEKEERGGSEPAAAEAVVKDAELQTAAASALSAAAVKAKHLAAVEERKIKSLVALLVETQMKKLEIKLRHFEELETIMDREREALEYQRQQLVQERQQFHMEQLRAAEYRARQRMLQEQQQAAQAQQTAQQTPPNTTAPAQPTAQPVPANAQPQAPPQPPQPMAVQQVVPPTQT